MQYLYGHDETVAAFVAELIPHRHGRPFGPCVAIGVLDDDRLIGGIVYDNWDKVSGIIEISGAATTPRWLTRETIARIYNYPFLQLGVQMVVMRTPADNERVLGQLARFGYMFVKIPRMYGRDRDGVVCLFTAEDWAAHNLNRRVLAEQKEAA